MRQFAAKGLRIWNLGREAKVIYSFFCVLSLLALFSSLLLYEDLVGPTFGGAHMQRVRDYYGAAQTDPASQHGTQPAALAEAASGAGSVAGPAIALPSDEPVAAEPAHSGPARLTITVPYRKLLEVTHFHLFTVPVFLLILTHLFLLTGLRHGTQLGWIVAGWTSAFLHMGTPWLLRVVSPRWAWLHAATGAAFFLTSLVLCLLPLWLMWRPLRRSRRDRHGKRHAPTGASTGQAEQPISAVELDSAPASRVDTE